MLSILFVSNKKYFVHLFITSISALIHQSSILFNGLIIISLLNKIRSIKLSKINIFLILLITLIFIYCLPSIVNKLFLYITLYKKSDLNGTTIIAPAKSAILLWIMNFVPSIIFLKNKNKFKINSNLKSIFTSFSIVEILLLPIIIFNSVIGYRSLLYIFPISIYITSLIPELNFFNIKKEYTINFIVSIAFISLIVWLKFAYHSSCWVPYKNIFFNF